MEKLMTLNLKEQDHLEEVISLISKTVKGDRELIYHILFNGLSAFTSNFSINDSFFFLSNWK